MNRIFGLITRNEIQGYTVRRYPWITHDEPYSRAKQNHPSQSSICQALFSCLNVNRHFTTNPHRFQGFVTEDAHEKPTESDVPTTEVGNSSNISVNPKTTKKKRRSRVKKSFVWSTWNRPEAHLDIETESAILKGDMKCRSRPIKVINPPETVTRTINNIIKGDIEAEIYGDIGDNFGLYWDAAVKFKTYLHSRKPCMEEQIKTVNRNRIEDRVRRKLESEVEALSRYDELQLETDIQKETERIFKLQIATYDQQSKHIRYDKSAAWAYLLGRAAFDYATMHKIMLEIRNRTKVNNESDKSATQINYVSFQPRTLFDFGSGVGTSIWAAKDIFGDISEAFCVDSSKDMTDLAITLLTKGHSQHNLPAGYSFRLHLPRDATIQYDLVTCAHSLLHIPSALERINVIDSLWRKTMNGGFFIIVENGTNAGFQVVQEARHYLSQIASPTNTSHEMDNILGENVDDMMNENRTQNLPNEAASQRHDLQGYLFSPCPHTKSCPRFEFDTIPCSFDMRYRNFSLDKINKSVREDVHEGRFSYVVFKKGENVKDCRWQRVVEPIKACDQSHKICRICTNRGTLEEILLSNVNKGPKSNRLHSRKLVEKYAKSLNVGDQFKGHLECGFENYDDFVKWASEKIKT